MAGIRLALRRVVAAWYVNLSTASLTGLTFPQETWSDRLTCPSGTTEFFYCMIINVHTCHSFIMKLFFHYRKKGQTLVEYALIIAFVSIVAISVLFTLGQEANATKITITQQLAEAQASH